MPIWPFLAGQAFDPETIRDMSLALEKVCEALNLKMVDDAATRLVAEKIIKLAQWGVRDVTSLTADAERVQGRRLKSPSGPAHRTILGGVSPMSGRSPSWAALR